MLGTLALLVPWDFMQPESPSACYAGFSTGVEGHCVILDEETGAVQDLTPLQLEAVEQELRGRFAA